MPVPTPLSILRGTRSEQNSLQSNPSVSFGKSRCSLLVSNTKYLAGKPRLYFSKRSRSRGNFREIPTCEIPVIAQLRYHIFVSMYTYRMKFVGFERSRRGRELFENEFPVF